MSGRKLARRACDGCKIRKIKCSESTPCEGCQNAKIPCTWLKQAQPRGPRRLREATLQEIRKAQDILHHQGPSSSRVPGSRSQVNDPDPPPHPSREVGRLVLYLCVYRVQLYPIWPIIKVERLIASLQSERPDVEVYALAYALAAATASRTGSTDLGVSDGNHAEILEGKCQAARAKVPHGRAPNLNTVRIAFFLHVYYESLEASSMKSMLYLREAVTIATIIGLHKEGYYLDVPQAEREIRRRVLWLLFNTERVVSVLYEQPITLRTRIELPSTLDTDDQEVLVGFQVLCKLFRYLDETGMFNMLEDLDIQPSPGSTGYLDITSGTRNASLMDSTAVGNLSPNGSETGHRPSKFHVIIERETAFTSYIPHVQMLDLKVTSIWLHVLDWRIQRSHPDPYLSDLASKVLPKVEELVQYIERVSPNAFEAHGIVMQLKLSTIAATILDMSTASSNFMQGNEWTQLSSRLNQALPLNIPIPVVPQPYSPLPNTSAKKPASQEDFAFSNNYDGLFDAVQAAGQRSSDSIEDLFSETSLEAYHNVDADQWADRMDSQPYLWPHSGRADFDTG